MPRWQSMHTSKLLTILVIVMTGSFGCDFGVQGGASALTAKFTGIDSAKALSPASITVNWTPQAGYVGYTVYSSAQDTPLVTLHAGNAYTISGLRSNTTYNFSVVGTSSDGNQFGVAKQVQATTLNNFLGPTSAVVVDSQSVSLTWSYSPGPIFQVYYAAGAPPTIATGSPLALVAPAFTTSSGTGYTVGGLSPNTLYYFMAVAKYADGTDSFQNSQISSGTVAAQYVATGGMSILPVISTQSNQLNNVPPIFTVTNSVNTYQSSFWLVDPAGAVHPECGTSLCKPLGMIAGNGSLTASQNLPAGTQTILITTTDVIIPGLSAKMEFSAISVATALPNNGLRVVNATTPSGLNPIPTITTNPISLGQFPAFTVSGSQPSYITTIYNGATPLGSVTGNGVIKTATSAPLPQGLNTLRATVTANGQSAAINNIQVRIKTADAALTPSAATVNGNIGAQGVGNALVVGDFNCDGRPDLAVGAPFGNGVYVYYGSAAGLDFSAAPSTTPLAGKPLFITNPSTWSAGQAFYGTQVGNPALRPGFGVSLAAGNFNGAYNFAPNLTCSDLVVGADGAFTEGVFAVYYGSPSGLQTTGALQENAFTCLGGGSYSCSPAYYRPSTAGVSPGVATWNTGYNEGIGYALAVGDVNGDGYDDIVATGPNMDQLLNNGTQGLALLYMGTANGISPNPTKISLPANMTQFNSTFGRQVVIGHFKTSPRSPGYSPSSPPVGPSDIAFSFYNLSATAPGVPQFPGTQSGVFVITGSSAPPYVDVNGSGIANSFTLIIPPQCNWSLTAPGWSLGGFCAYGPNSLLAMDLNQDGYDDIVFSNPRITTPIGSRGAVFAYFGGSNLTTEGAQTTIPSIANTCSATNCTTPQAFYLAGTTSTTFGSSLSYLGDMNGDGYPELGIGDAIAGVGSATSSGNGYIYHTGSSGITATALVRISPTKPKNAFFGTAMAGAKFSSITGMADYQSQTALTYNDLAVGAIGESPANRDPVKKIAVATGTGPLGSEAQGTVSLFSNASPGFSGSVTTPVAVLAPDSVKPFNLTTSNVFLAGDLNGDGFSDAIMQVSVPGPMQSGALVPFATYQLGFVVYYGSPTGFVTSHLIGGVNTLILPSYSPLSPTDPLFVTNSLIKSGSFDHINFAYMIMPAGDVNGDGFADVVTSEAFYTGGFGFVFHGSSSGLIVSPTPAVIPFGPGNRPSLDPMIISMDGWNLPLLQNLGNLMPGMNNLSVTFGDFNGDGCSDVVWQNQVGDTLVIYGSRWGLVTDGDLYDSHTAVGTYAAALATDKLGLTPNCTDNYPYGAFGPKLVCTPLVIPAAGNPGVAGIMSAGDMDGDGTDDLVSINSKDATWNAGAGTISIYYGNTAQGINPNIFVNLRITPLTPLRYLGTADYGYHPLVSGAYGRAYDVNGDGLQDIVLDSNREITAYIIYGLGGGGLSPTVNSGPYIGAGMCASYPCYQNITPVAAADYNPIHVLDVTAAQPSSCSSATGSCNVMRWATPSINNNFGADGIFGVGDITGDAYGDIVMLRQNVTLAPGVLGAFYIYSGSPNGLQVTTPASTQPNCFNGICDPTIIRPPSVFPAGVTTSSPIYWFSTSWQNPSDVDGDGKRDFLITSEGLNSVDLNGNINGLNTGGFLLFH